MLGEEVGPSGSRMEVKENRVATICPNCLNHIASDCICDALVQM